MMIIPIVIGARGTDTKGLLEGLEKFEISGRVDPSNPNTCIIEIGQNIEKSPGGLRRLAVTLTPVNDHQLTLM